MERLGGDWRGAFIHFKMLLGFYACISIDSTMRCASPCGSCLSKARAEIHERRRGRAVNPMAKERKVATALGTSSPSFESQPQWLKRNGLLQLGWMEHHKATLHWEFILSDSKHNSDG